MPLLSTRGAASARGFGFGGSGTAAQATDPYFNYTTLLLPGNGTNGGQNNTFLDSSSNNFTITRNGNTTQGTFSPFSQTGWSNYFDGSGDYLTLPSNSAFAFGTGDFTAECWVYFISFVGANQALFDFRDGLDTTSLEMGVYSNNIPFLSNSSGGVLNGSFTFSVGTWYHIAFTRSGTSLNIWVNGTNVGSTSNSTNWTGNNCKIGGNPNGAENPNAYISNARVVKGTAVYTSAFTPPTAPLTAISGTSLLTCQSNRFIDNSSNAFTITVNGNTSVQAFSPFAPTDEYDASTVGGSGYFDGSGDGVSATLTSATPGTGDFTYEGWYYRLPSTSTYGYDAFSTRSGDTADGISMAFLDTGAILVGYTGVNFINTSSGVFNTGAWAHIAVVRSSGTITLWVNGVSQGTSSRADNFTSTSFNLGNWDVGLSPGFYGYISNFRYTTTAVYTSTFTPPTAPVTNITNTKLLLNFTNAGIIDNTAKNDLETVGNAQISTSVSKFGGGSIAFDGSGDYLTTYATPQFAFGSGDFTIECWVYFNSLTQYDCIIDFRPSGTNGAYPCILVDTSNTLVYYVNTANRITSSAVATGQWYHLAVSRTGTSTKMFLNGVQTGSTYSDSNSYLVGNPLTIGGLGYNSPGTYALDGYLDDFRITKGIARYTSNFTPPTSAFPLL